jgi:hypothetical protein
MTATTDQFVALLETMGSDVVYHRELPGDICPCRTPEGFRDPAWHKANPTAPVCNEQGYLTVAEEFFVKAAIQPATGQQRARAAERIDNLLYGEIREDDHYGVFPVRYGGHTLDFSSFSDSGEDYVIYDDRRFVVVAADKLADVDGDPDHHWEVGLRLVKTERPA